MNKHNSCSANLTADHREAAKRTDHAQFNVTLNDDWLPDIERITQSLRKVQEITAAAHLLWPNKKTAGKITADVVEIINQVCKRKFSFCNGKSLRCIVGGLFYLLGFRYDDPKKQREIAIAMQITVESIRSSYKKWLKEFPDLFQDIAAKLADQELRHNCYPTASPPLQTDGS
jgi:hypothetical protein